MKVMGKYCMRLLPSPPPIFSMSKSLSFHLSKQNYDLPIQHTFYPVHANCKLFRAETLVYYFSAYKEPYFQLEPLGAAVILIILILIILLVENLAQHLRLK